MRLLTEEELVAFFEKLSKYIGENVRHLVEGRVFRLIGKKVYYISEEMLRQASVFGRDELVHCGTCFGQFSAAGKFRLSISALDYISKYAKAKVWVKNSGEQNFVYGNHVLKAHVARLSENAVKYGGVVVMSMSNVALGFGVLAKSGDELKTADPTAIFVFNQADVGQYLRVEGE